MIVFHDMKGEVGFDDELAADNAAIFDEASAGAVGGKERGADNLDSIRVKGRSGGFVSDRADFITAIRAQTVSQDIRVFAAGTLADLSRVGKKPLHMIDGFIDRFLWDGAALGRCC
jgi:hypothetical protein